MTETVGGSAKKTAARAAAKPAAALKVQRVYTTEGRHPYDEVTWERRDVVMTNWRDGSVNFEQRGVEFPEFWSVNATNIVTSKYFRGAVGSDKREQSLYFPEQMLKEIQEEANRQDRSLSWIVQKAWKIARKDIMKYPSVNELADDAPDDERGRDE